MLRNSLIVLILISSSCITQKRCLERYPPSRDTTYIETVKETIIPLPGDTINIEVPVRCPNQDVVLVENNRLKQTIRILNGKLLSTTEIKPDTIKVTTIQTKEVIKEVSKPLKYTPKFYLFCTYALIGIVIALAGWMALKIIK
jgi:hypothetical protein